LDLRAVSREEVGNISMTKILYVKESPHNQYPDFLEDIGLMVSEKLKQIMCKYQQDVIFKTFALIEKEANNHNLYYLMSPPQIKCTSAMTVYDKQGQIEKFVLDTAKVGSTRIFCSDDYKNKVFVRLDVAESILRRNPYGVSFLKVEC
jgi:hypothetical protein